MKEEGHVLVIGAANLDVKGRPETALVRGSSVPGVIQSSLGGVARNIAENLARLEVETVLLTSVGDDDAGARILGQAAGSGIDISEVLISEGQRTGAYMALLAEDGALDIAMDDMGILTNLTPAYFEERYTLFRNARVVAIDANLTPEALETVLTLCQENEVPVCAEPTSNLLAERLCPHLSRLHMATPNVPEAQVMCGDVFAEADREAAQAAAAHLVALGVDVAIITLGKHGVVYADAETKGHVPAIQTYVVDSIGAGDAQAAAIIFGLIEDLPLDECVRLGVAAATLTLRTQETVRPDLSIDLLYDALTI
ncbi:MAG: carbohydrate kinase family protein [Anaerolineae bacterium]|nr:carbohydrate kinase family protein [Anaerolineae bacterium]